MKNDCICMFNHELLFSYVSGNVTPEERSEVERHLAQCPTCRHEVMDLEKTWWALDVWHIDSDQYRPRLNDLNCRIDVSEPNLSFWQKMIQRIRFYISLIQPVPATALATLVGGILFLVWIQPQHQSPANQNTMNASKVVDKVPSSRQMLNNFKLNVDNKILENNFEGVRVVNNREKQNLPLELIENSRIQLHSDSQMGYENVFSPSNDVNSILNEHHPFKPFMLAPTMAGLNQAIE